MSKAPKRSFTPLQEGAIGAVVGAVLGAGLHTWDIITAPAVVGVAAGVGIGSWFNARRRANRD